jgi:hypothetical protein
MDKKFPNFNMAEYKMSYDYSARPQTRGYLANIGTAKEELEMFRGLNDEFKRTGIQGVNSLLQSGEIQFGGVTANNFNTAKAAFEDSLSTILGAAGVSPTDMRLEQARKTLQGAQTAAQVKSGLEILESLINIREKANQGRPMPTIDQKLVFDLWYNKLLPKLYSKEMLNKFCCEIPL